MKIAIIGSREYENIRKIKDTLFQLKQKFGDKLIKFERGENFFSKDFKLSIHTYFGSSFLESMINDIPSILIIQNFDANDKFTVSQLNNLKKYHVVFTSSKKASFFINKNWKIDIY